MSNRIAILSENFDKNYSLKNAPARSEIYREVFLRHAGESADIKIARAFEAFLERKEIILHEEDLFAGHLQYYQYKDSVPVNMPDFFEANANPSMPFDIKREIENYFETEGSSRGGEDLKEEKNILDEFLFRHNNGFFLRWGSGHVVCSYDRIIELGLPELIESVNSRFLSQKDKERKDAAEAMLITLKALQSYILRCARESERALNASSDPDYRASLKRISDSCARIAGSKPTCLFDALQLFVLVLDAMISENASGSISIGRFDQFIYPYYEADKNAGKISAEEASELIDAVWLKIASLKQSFQNMTLGGCDKNGDFAGNEITLMAMRSSAKIARDQPLLTFRCRKGMPEEFWREIIALIKTGLGFPALFNDDVIFDAKINSGVAPEDVWRYALVGCVEPSIPGDEYSNTEELRVNWAKVLEIMINPGGACNLRPNKKVPLDSIASFDEFYLWYKSELEHLTELGMKASNLLDSSFGKTWPAPFMSSLTEDCPAKGQDITRGALKYSFSTVNGTGMADVIDSLLAVKEIVFEQKKMSLKDFADIVNSDFLGREDLRSELLIKTWRYGNDERESNFLIKDLTQFFVDTVTKTGNVFGNKFQAGLYSVGGHAAMGAKTGPLPSGRRGGVSLANALSPCQGADTNGPTAVMCSAVSVDHRRLGNGLVLDLKFTPQFLEKPSHLERLRELITGYFEMGGMEIQFNVVKRETLVAAQKHPEKYRNLIVRVSGFSAYFVQLDRLLQDEIIARTEYAGHE